MSSGLNFQAQRSWDMFGVLAGLTPRQLVDREREGNSSNASERALEALEIALCMEMSGLREDAIQLLRETEQSSSQIRSGAWRSAVAASIGAAWLEMNDCKSAARAWDYLSETQWSDYATACSAMIEFLERSSPADRPDAHVLLEALASRAKLGYEAALQVATLEWSWSGQTEPPDLLFEQFEAIRTNLL
jgi:thioredoxin-like negative regulator of GroEL